MQPPAEDISKLSPLRRALLGIEKLQSKLDAVERGRVESIAVIGMACRFPGSVRDAETYWELLRAGVEARETIPADRWEADALYRDTGEPGSVGSKHGHFIRDVYGFDANFFGISPREALAMDPQQRLLLEITWEALEHAGLPATSMSGTRTAVFVGVSSCDYATGAPQDLEPRNVDGYSGTGVLFSVAAGRIAHSLGLVGPALAIDTACSSSLVALHMACASLRLHECDTALVGGVNLILSPFASMFLTQAGALSPDGRCRTFDAAADGYGRGEGCGVVVLRRASDIAAASGRAFAYIRGSAVNHDGHSSGLTVPNGVAQQDVIRRALLHAQVEAKHVGYVEAHGTGTALGDPIELRALAAVYGSELARDQPLLVGSVKTNIGHLEAAAGIASFIKAVQCVRYGEIPRHLHFAKLNPHAASETAALAVPTSHRPWPEPGERIAGISAFGMAGTNAHMIVSNAPGFEVASSAAFRPSDSVQADSARPLHILALSAKTPEALGDVVRSYAALLAKQAAPDFAAVCFSTNAGRAHFRHRFAVVAADANDALSQLNAWDADAAQPGARRKRDVAPLVFVFGAARPRAAGVIQSLYTSQAVFRDAVARCCESVGSDAADFVMRSMCGPAAADPCEALSPVAETVLGYALAKLWESWGITPDTVLGFGVGEYAALIVAEHVTLAAGLELSVRHASSGAHGASNPAADSGARLGSASDAGEQLPEPARGFDALGRYCLPVTALTEPAAWRSVLPEVARLYEAGHAIDWIAFAAGQQQERVDLPSYPFRHTQYRRTAAPTRLPVRDDENLPTRLLGKRWRAAIPDVIFGTRFSTERLPFLDDHVFHDTVIVAGATYLATVLAAAERLWGAEAAHIVDIALPEPMILEKGAEREVQLVLTPHGRDYKIRIVSLHTPDGSDPAPELQPAFKLHLMGQLTRDASASLDPKRALAADTLDELQARSWDQLPSSEFYEGGERYGLHAGPSFRWIRTLGRGEVEAFAQIAAPLGTPEGLDALTVHPGLIDSCFQLSIATLQLGAQPARAGAVPVVARVERLHWSGRRIPSKCWAHLRVRSFDSASNSVTEFASDLRLWDESGALLLTVEGLHIQLVDLSALVRRSKARSLGWIYGMEWPVRPHTANSTQHPEPTWLILSQHDQADQAITQCLASISERCVVVRTGIAPDSADGSAPGIERIDAASIATLLREAQLSNRELHVVYVAPVQAPSESDGPNDSACDATTRLLQSVTGLFQGLVQHELKCRVWVVTRGAQLLSERDATSPLTLAHAALWGWARVARREQPAQHWRSIDLDPSDEAGSLRQLIAELSHPERDEDEVVYRQGQRHLPRLTVALEQPDAEQQHATISGPELSQDSTYLVTGAFGGLGPHLARELAARGARRMILVGRRGVDAPGASALLDELEQLGCHVRAVAADVSDRSSVSRLLAQVDAKHPLRGIVHAAGLLDDALLINQDADRIGALLAPKVQGAWNLHVLTREHSLDFFVMFSSVAAILGSPGQSAYAAANAFLDGLVHERRRSGQRAVSINWGPWQGDGMAASVNEGYFRHWGLDLIDPHEGRSLFGRMLSGKAPGQVVALKANWSTFFTRLGAHAAPSLLARLRPAQLIRRSVDDGVSKRLKGAAAIDRQRLLTDLLRELTNSVLGFPSSAALDPEAPLQELGMDSMLAIELHDVLQTSLSISLPATLLYDVPTLTALADYLIAQLDSQEG